MAGASSIPPVANASMSPTQGGHEGHGNGGGNAEGGAFSGALSQAIAQQAGSPMSTHAAHGGVGSSGNSQGIGHSSGMLSNNAAGHSAHFPIGQGGHGSHDFQQKMLGVRAYRQQLIASNIANADTPGYKAVDIDIEQAAEIVRGASASLPLANTVQGHLSGSKQPPPFPLKYHVPYQPAADGNTVEMDVERAKFAENSTMYEFSLDRVSGHFKHMMEMLQNLK